MERDDKLATNANKIRRRRGRGKKKGKKKNRKIENENARTKIYLLDSNNGKGAINLSDQFALFIYLIFTSFFFIDKNNITYVRIHLVRG